MENTPWKIKYSPMKPFSPGSPSEENIAIPDIPARAGQIARKPPKSSIPRSPPLRRSRIATNAKRQRR